MADHTLRNTEENNQSAQSSEDGAKTSGWPVIAAASAVLFVGVGYSNTYGVFQDHYHEVLFPSIAPEKLIVIGSVASSLYFILGALTGRFADLVGYRISLLLGSSLMIGAMFAASVSKSYTEIFLSQGLMFGIGLAFVYMPATSISRQYFGNQHGLANGIVVSGGALGGCILPYSVQVMLGRYGLAATFRILGYLAAGILIPSILLLRPKARLSRPRKVVDLALLKDKRFVWMLVGCTIAMAGFLPRYFLVPSSARARGISSTYASWLLGIMNGLSIFGRIGIGCFADRYGKLTALSLSFLLCGLGHFAFWLPGTISTQDDTRAAIALMTIFVVYVGFFGSGFISLFPVVVADLFGSENLASKTGMLNTFVGLSTLAGPSAVYAIVGPGVSLRWALGISTAGTFMIVGGLVLPITRALSSKRQAWEVGRH
ncbi:MFS transporter asaE [Pseudocercospora fuligena]|uniref:MFS transporter asaE n=1 Tax=Pseudocercospora fuligena TaxID=685502 RepID=A0A8H6R9Z3_9PEZI|nr:MFS transporter asaE [Pseudocercospora fuligena]